MIVIVTDSSACLTREEAEALGISVVPMTYSCGAQAMTEGYVDENGAFDRLIERAPEQLHTSQASMAAFVRAFQDIVDEGNEALCLTMSSRMSGTYSNAVFAAREVAPDRIRVVDSLSTAGGMYQLCVKARELINVGMPLERVAAELEAMRERVRLVFTVEDIEPLRRSGRISGLKMSVSTILNIRPILGCTDGALSSCGIARGRNDQRRQLIQKVPKGVDRVLVQSYKADEQARVLAHALHLGGAQTQLRPLGPVLAIHLGAGVVGLCWVDPE